MLSTSALEDAVNKCIRILPKMFFKFLGAQLTNKLWTRFPPDSHLHRRKNLLHLASHAQQLQCKGYRGHLSKRSAPLQHSMEVGLSKLSEFLWQPTSMSTNKIKRVHRPTLTDSIVTILSINILGQSVSKHANVQKLRPQKCYLLDGFLALHFSIFPPLQPDVHKYWDSLTSMWKKRSTSGNWTFTATCQAIFEVCCAEPFHQALDATLEGGHIGTRRATVMRWDQQQWTKSWLTNSKSVGSMKQRK